MGYYWRSWKVMVERIEFEVEYTTQRISKDTYCVPKAAHLNWNTCSLYWQCGRSRLRKDQTQALVREHWQSAACRSNFSREIMWLPISFTATDRSWFTLTDLFRTSTCGQKVAITRQERSRGPFRFRRDPLLENRIFTGRHGSVTITVSIDSDDSARREDIVRIWSSTGIRREAPEEVEHMEVWLCSADFFVFVRVVSSWCILGRGMIEL